MGLGTMLRRLGGSFATGRVAIVAEGTFGGEFAFEFPLEKEEVDEVAREPSHFAIDHCHSVAQFAQLFVAAHCLQLDLQFQLVPFCRRQLLLSLSNQLQHSLQCQDRVGRVGGGFAGGGEGAEVGHGQGLGKGETSETVGAVPLFLGYDIERRG